MRSLKQDAEFTTCLVFDEWSSFQAHAIHVAIITIPRGSAVSMLQDGKFPMITMKRGVKLTGSKRGRPENTRPSWFKFNVTESI